MDEFTEFLKGKQAESDLGNAMLEQKKNKYVANVKCLMEQIKGWLKEQVEQGLMAINEGEIELEYQTVGRYRVAAMRLQIQDRIIDVKPAGAFIVGADGKIDIVTNRQTGMILCFRDNGWKIITKVGGQNQFRDFTEAEFKEFIKKLF
jgi:hypothetical protein